MPSSSGSMVVSVPMRVPAGKFSEMVLLDRVMSVGFSSLTVAYVDGEFLLEG